MSDLEITGFSDVLLALRHMLNDVASASEGIILETAIAEIERRRADGPWDKTIFQQLKAMPSSLNDACRTMDKAADIIARQERALRSIALNSCCEGCREANKVALAALLYGAHTGEPNECNDAYARGERA